MNKKERQALLKILLVREELTDKEFNNVIEFIRAELSDGQDTEKTIKKQFSSKKKSWDSITTLILSLKDTENEKYQIINGLHKLMQDGSILKTVSEARKFGNVLGLKDTSSQSKSDIIYNIIEALVGMESRTVAQMVSKMETTTDKHDESYHRLSEFIIESGKGAS
ncbi:hypothetical protein HWQ46_01885 [Shewanella sp. D64]|uniref:hypothetical protein n=1 Tax=unclassified Shewanella TaxID=196818 RepID=UPI0022BA6565|nr:MULTISPECIES: hypothetical protein [unclassified Shewanella]MEC4724298.1 hypothetical protein [Shewanella sp. D64]MEC4738810.1 hypothetical protein [Shewanella sp. E94]WBJ97751.1 hypothetical protein HWQ47_11970 [Shewanella sp. MTB7]